MKKIDKILHCIIVIIAMAILNCANSFAQGVWTQKANFGGVIRYGAVGCSIGNKGYIGMGTDGTNRYMDFWEWDQASDTWTQKADFGGGQVAVSGSFSISTQGYIGTEDGFVPGDFWEWDQSSNVWSQKANFGELFGTIDATGFSIGTKGYIGTGLGKGSGEWLKDFWEWDQITDTWTQKADFGGTGRISAVGFSIGNKGYIGTGHSIQGINVGDKKDFWEWDQSSNVWSKKADFGGGARQSAIGFSIGTKGYIGTGISSADAVNYKDFWEWDQSSNKWTQIVDFGGTARNYAVGFSIGNKGYIGTGVDNFGLKQDFWEFDPSAQGIVPCVLCGKDKITICHIPPGNTGNPQTLCIGQSALPAHLAHGDICGPCGSGKQFASSGEENAESGIDEREFIAEKEFTVNVYPNPFSGKMEIIFNAPKGMMKLQIFDVKGQVVATLFDGVATSDKTYSQEFDAEKLPAGIYFYRITTANEILHNKLVIIK